MPETENLVLRGAARAVEIAGERYTNMSGLRALVSFIPGVGGALDLLISGEGARIQQQRILRMIEDLQLDMALIDPAMFDQTFIHSEDFYDLFVATTERVTRTADELHVQALRSVFVTGTLLGTGDATLKTLVLHVVGDFTGDHVRILRAVRDLEPISESDSLPPLDEYLKIDQLRAKFKELGGAKFTAIVNDLIRMGVLAGNFPTVYGGGTGEPAGLTLSLFGREVAKFLSITA